MNREQAINYLKSSGMSEEQIKDIISALTCEDCISREAVLNALCNDCELYKNEKQTCFSKCEEYHFLVTLPSVQSKIEQEQKTVWNNHQIACMLADLFGDTCACNYNGIDEWLGELCDFKDTCCPNPVGVACWEQFLKHSQSRYTECVYEIRDKESVLDKVRADINNLTVYYTTKEKRTNLISQKAVNRIIDKYRGSEE